MGHQIVKQPDGKLAIFSDSVNDWIVWDATAEEVVEYYAERAAESARESARRTVGHVMADEPRKSYYQFTQTFAVLNAVSKHGQGHVLPGPVDEGKLAELEEQERLFSLEQDGHLILGSEDTV